MVRAMRAQRRTFMGAMLAAGMAPAIAAVPGRMKAVAFDGIALFDPRPVDAMVQSMFPEKGRELAALWRTRQFEYTWLRNSMGRYADFAKVTEDALAYAAHAVKVDVPIDARQRLVAAFHELRAWPDVPAALAKLRQGALRLAIVSNFTPAMMRGAIRASGLEGLFDATLSTDLARVYKPDPRAYALAPKACRSPVTRSPSSPSRDGTRRARRPSAILCIG
jgi:2-haloacid dehalogenase